MGAVLPKAIPHPCSRGIVLPADGGRTGSRPPPSTPFHNTGQYLKAYAALASVPDCPLRLHCFTTCPSGGRRRRGLPEPSLVRKERYQLWADGSPVDRQRRHLLEYLDNPTTRTAEMELGPRGETQMNYTGPNSTPSSTNWSPPGFQMAFHCNGDVGFDGVLDAYARALAKFNLLGSDHRWRVEHLGAARRDQFDPAALGVTCSLSPFQYIYWGDLLDGGDVRSGLRRPVAAGPRCVRGRGDAELPQRWIGVPTEPVVQRDAHGHAAPLAGRCGADQSVTLDQALRAITINGAYQLKRDHEIGSLAVGKYADMVELSADIHRAGRADRRRRRGARNLAERQEDRKPSTSSSAKSRRSTRASTTI